jgi:hypothetical protein
MADQPLGALVLEYEQTLKRVCMGGDLNADDIDSAIHFLAQMRICGSSSFFGGRCCATQTTTSFLNWPWKAAPIFWLPSTPGISWMPSVSAFG